MAIKSHNPILDEIFYNEAAREYCASLPLEHFMESAPAATQREITTESFALVRAARPEVKFFNELLVQYPVDDIQNLARVVPDNMVVLHDGHVRVNKSFNVPFQKAKPFLVLEYVSEENRRKDYVDNMRRYEQDLKVPYYLLFEPDKKQVVLFKLSASKKKYVSVKPNRHDRLAIPELELEVGLVDGWVRFWFRDALLRLPDQLQADEAEAQKRAAAAEAEVARLRDELKRLRGGG
jgi:Uma2 family endonuclease